MKTHIRPAIQSFILLLKQPMLIGYVLLASWVWTTLAGCYRWRDEQTGQTPGFLAVSVSVSELESRFWNSVPKSGDSMSITHVLSSKPLPSGLGVLKKCK